MTTFGNGRDHHTTNGGDDDTVTPAGMTEEGRCSAGPDARLSDVAHPVRRLLGLALLVAVCAACHVDVAVDVAMIKDGSGTITVTVTADKDIVAKAPGLAGDLRLADVAAAGWAVEGPAPTPDGGLQVVMRQSFQTPAQANAILTGLNG